MAHQRERNVVIVNKMSDVNFQNMDVANFVSQVHIEGCESVSRVLPGRMNAKLAWVYSILHGCYFICLCVLKFDGCEFGMSPTVVNPCKSC